MALYSTIQNSLSGIVFTNHEVKCFRAVLLIGFMLIFQIYSIFAQPMEMHGCHMRFKDAHQRVDPTFENRYFRASTERSDSFDILDYDLTIDLRGMTSKILRGEATVTFQPKLDDLNILPLDLLKMQVDSVKFNGEVVSFEYDNLLLNVTMPAVMNSGQTYAITVWYHGTPTISSSGFGGFYFEDGIAYNLGIGLTDDPHNFGRSWFPCFDNFVERSTYTYRIISANEVTSFSVGNLTDEQPFEGSSKIRTFRMEQEIPTYLSAIAASTFTTHEYIHTAPYGEVPIQLISKPSDLDKVVSSFKNVHLAVDCLESWYGKYPFDRVGYVMTTVGAMEHPNCIAYPISSVGVGGENRRLMAHELCHLWWGDLLTLRTQADMWIKEGNAEYGAHLFDEFISGREVFENSVNANRFEVITKAHVNDNGYLPLSPMPKRITYGTTTYNKGAMVMHSLRGYLGDDVFRTGQQGVLQEYAYKNLTADTYQASLEKATGVDLDDFFNRWVQDSGFFDFVIVDFKPVDIPEYSHTLTIKQKLLKASDFLKDAPLWITFIDEQNQFITQKFICSGEISEFEVNLPGEIKTAFINTPMTLNLAQFNTTKLLNTTGPLVLANAAIIARVDALVDSTYLFIEQHLTAADPDVKNDWPMCEKRFWRISIADPEKVELSGRISYNDEYDINLMHHGEDSIYLMYRPDGLSDWTPFPYCVKQGGSNSDLRGNFQVSKYLPGEYAFGNIDVAILKTKKWENLIVSTFPNPTNGEFQVILPENSSSQDLQIKMFDAAGIPTKCFVEKINTGLKIDMGDSNPSGTYFILVSDKEGSIIGTSELIFVK